MFDMYQHKGNPTYRVIVRAGAELPPEVIGEWMLLRTGVNKVCSEAVESIEKDGYYLYKPIKTYAEIEVANGRAGAIWE